MCLRLITRTERTHSSLKRTMIPEVLEALTTHFPRKALSHTASKCHFILAMFVFSLVMDEGRQRLDGDQKWPQTPAGKSLAMPNEHSTANDGSASNLYYAGIFPLWIRFFTLVCRPRPLLLVRCRVMLIHIRYE